METAAQRAAQSELRATVHPTHLAFMANLATTLGGRRPGGWPAIRLGRVRGLGFHEFGNNPPGRVGRAGGVRFGEFGNDPWPSAGGDALGSGLGECAVSGFANSATNLRRGRASRGKSGLANLATTLEPSARGHALGLGFGGREPCGLINLATPQGQTPEGIPSGPARASGRHPV